ncbi:MAG: aldehyde dehydrogenase, partial [Prosthecobacter sp.]
MSHPHLPALRKGRPYESLDKVQVKDHKTGEICAEVSQVNAGIVRKDLAKIAEARKSLKKFTVEQLLDITAKAGDLFLNGTLSLGDKGHTQSPQEYIATLSRTSGLPHIMVKRNMTKIH